jgi:hypothetical protein
MTPRMNPLIKVEYFASLIIGGALAHQAIGGVIAVIAGAFLGAVVFFMLSTTILAVPVAAGLWGFGAWFLMDLITQGNTGASSLAGLIAGGIAAVSHMSLHSEINAQRPSSRASQLSETEQQAYSPYTKYVDEDGREYDENGTEIV